MLRILFLLYCLFLLSACDSNMCEEEVLARTANDNKKVELVYLRVNCGATTNFSHKVFLVPFGGNIEESKPIFVADKVRKLDIDWNNNQIITIEFENARIFQFTNFWHSSNVDNFEFIVDIKLSDLTEPNH